MLRAAPLLLALLGSCSALREAREMGDAIGTAIGNSIFGTFEVFRRIDSGDPPDFVTRPGDPGHVATAARGEERHYYVKRNDRTQVVGDVPVGDEVLENRIVAEYAGPPPYRSGPIWIYPPPALLLVDAPKGWTIRVENEEGEATTLEVGDETQRFQLSPGRWQVVRENDFLWFDGKQFPVDLHAHEKVVCSLSRKRLVKRASIQPAPVADARQAGG